MELSIAPPQNSGRLLAEFVSATWLPHIRARKASWKLEANIAKNHILPDFGGRPLASISTAEVEGWLTALVTRKCAPATRNRRMYVLKSIFNLAVEHGVIPVAPTRSIQCRRVKKTRWPSLDRQQLAALLDALSRSPRSEARAIALLLHTGAHKSEILHARWENLFLQEGFLLAPRTGTPPFRKIWLSAGAQEILYALPRRSGSPWLFPGRDSSRPVSDIFLFWKELRTELGLGELSIRDLRYVFADWQLRSGMSMPALRCCLGVQNLQDLAAHQLCAEIRHAPVPA